MILNDLADKDPIKYAHIHARIIQIAEQWCKSHFNQPWVEIWEVGEVPTVYPNNIFGYGVIVKMRDYPYGKRIEVLIAPDESMSAQELS